MSSNKLLYFFFSVEEGVTDVDDVQEAIEEILPLLDSIILQEYTKHDNAVTTSVDHTTDPNWEQQLID